MFDLPMLLAEGSSKIGLKDRTFADMGGEGKVRGVALTGD
jgi:hypothetical protein